MWCCLAAGCTTRCFNAPQSWQLGWAKPLAQLESRFMPANEWYSYRLPAAFTTRDPSFLRVSPGCTDIRLGLNSTC